MDMAENSKSVVDKQENKQRNFAESGTVHFISRIDKNAENAIFGTRDENISIIGERYNAGNNCWSKEEREAPYGHQKCNWTLSK